MTDDIRYVKPELATAYYTGSHNTYKAIYRYTHSDLEIAAAVFSYLRRYTHYVCKLNCHDSYHWFELFPDNLLHATIGLFLFLWNLR